MNPMLRLALSLAALLMAFGQQSAFAQDRCGPSPDAPVIPNGKTATAAQLNAAATDVKAFIKSSDDWQLCLLTDLQKQKDATKGSKTPFDPKIETAINAKGDANQRDKEKVGAEYTAAAHAYNLAHPKN